ncbi:MAG: asparaginase [Pseudomonadota bacterium]
MADTAADAGAQSTPTNPVVCEVTRGPLTESVHRGALAVSDASGAIIAGIGDASAFVYPRSAIKALQAIPVLASGAAERFGFTPADIALLCASHSGEADHVARAEDLLSRAGFDPEALHCGAHWPLGPAATRDLAGAGGAPRKSHNNCSGKHAGMLASALATDADPARYTDIDSPVQQAVLATLKRYCGAEGVGAFPGIDGCGAPNWPVTIEGLARAFAAFGAGSGPAQADADTARRIRAAVAAHPHLVAGTDRFDTVMMAASGERVFVKTGAEGVYCGCLPEFGIGFALKIDDGTGRASEHLTATLITALYPDLTVAVADRHIIRNWAGVPVGRTVPAPVVVETVTELARQIRGARNAQ